MPAPCRRSRPSPPTRLSGGCNARRETPSTNTLPPPRPTREAFAANEIERRLQREAEIAIDKLRRAQAAKRTADDLAREVETLKQEVRTLREKAAAPPR